MTLVNILTIKRLTKETSSRAAGSVGSCLVLTQMHSKGTNLHGAAFVIHKYIEDKVKYICSTATDIVFNIYPPGKVEEGEVVREKLVPQM